MKHRPTIVPLALLLATPALAVLIDSADGSANTGSPPQDPDSVYVGTRGGLTAIHIGDGWVLTANHVGAGAVVLDGVTYPQFAGTVRLENPDGSDADLLLFAIKPFPTADPLEIADTTPAIDTDLILVGHGRDRGNATTWDPNGPPPPAGIDGYEWDTGSSLRWGTNHVEEIPTELVLGTWSFASFFDEAGSTHEAQGTNGDSGGAVFAWDGAEWELSGVLYAIAEFSGQPAETSLYGQLTYAADLSVYRDQILDVTLLPEPTGALPFGAALVFVLGHRRAPRRARIPAG